MSQTVTLFMFQVKTWTWCSKLLQILETRTLTIAPRIYSGALSWAQTAGAYHSLFQARSVKQKGVGGKQEITTIEIKKADIPTVIGVWN